MKYLGLGLLISSVMTGCAHVDGPTISPPPPPSSPGAPAVTVIAPPAPHVIRIVPLHYPAGFTLYKIVATSDFSTWTVVAKNLCGTPAGDLSVTNIGGYRFFSVIGQNEYEP